MIRLSVLVFVLVLAAAGVALFPLGVALDVLELERSGLTAGSATGTVWSGRLHGAAFRGLPLGEVRTQLQPSSLAGGTVRIAASAQGGAATGRGIIIHAGEGGGVQGLDATIPLNLFPTAAGLGGTLRLEGLAVQFRDGRCIVAQGRLTTDALQRGGALLGGAGPLLTGPARCEGGSLTFPLQGQAALGDVTLKLTLSPEGRYRLDTQVATRDPALAAALRLAGLAPNGDAYVRTEEGRWWR